MESLLGCKDLSVRFYHREENVLTDIHLSISRGEKVLILGPSGSGKSTLLSALSGIIPEHVEAEVEGEIQLAPQCGVMFQDPDSQFCMLHVDEEIAFSLENRSIPRAQMDTMIDTVMKQVGLNIDRHTAIETLSGGMKQRLALACLLALEPEVLFFDEPTAQLDPISRKEIFQLLHDLADQYGQTMVFVEHTLDGCIEWMDTVILMNAQGRIMAQGKPAEMIERYRAEMEESGIWQPQLFPYTWEDVQEHPSHPLAKQLQQTLQQRRTATLHADTTDNHTPDIIVTEQLEIGYRQKSVMSNMNISIQSGKWVAIVGANGSGKSTFLKSLIRLERIRSGQLSFQHKLLKKWSDRDLYEQAGFVFQNPELQFVTDTVFDEIAFGGRQRNWSEEEVTSKTIQLLQEFGLEAYQDQHPFTLSLGQKRRLSVATMLLFDQSLLLLDEPTFGQDAKTSAELIKRLQQRQAQGTTIVMVTHDMDLVDEYADTVILFDQGKVVYNGAPYHLFANPEQIGDHAIIPPLHYRLLQPQKERSIV